MGCVDPPDDGPVDAVPAAPVPTAAGAAVGIGRGVPPPSSWSWIVPTGLHLLLALTAVAVALDLTGTFTGAGWTSAFTNWDSRWYLEAARQGYPAAYPLPGNTNTALVPWGFFPLYPLTITVLHAVGLEYVHAGVIVSLAATAGLVLLLNRLARIEIGPRGAAWVPALVIFSPDGWFFTAVYTEALFYLLVVGAFLAARRGRFVHAGVVGLLASAARPTGVFLVPALLLEAFQQAGWRWRRVDRSALAVLLVPVGVAAFAIAAWLRTGNFDAYGAAQANALNATVVAPWTGLINTWNATVGQHGYLQGVFQSQLIAGLLGIPILAIAWWRLRPMYASFMTLVWLLAVSIGIWDSLPRYELAFFPVALLAVAWTRRAPWVRWLLILPSALAMAYGASEFARGIWLS